MDEPSSALQTLVRTRVNAPLPGGIKIDVQAMASMMERLAEHHRNFSFPRHQTERYRFYFDNPFFGCYDASILFSMLLEFRPRRIIEVGCGYSSCLLLDTNEQFFDGALKLTFIDPSLDNLKQLFGNFGEECTQDHAVIWYTDHVALTQVTTPIATQSTCAKGNGILN